MRKLGLSYLLFGFLLLSVVVGVSLVGADERPHFEVEVEGYYLTAGVENRLEVSITNVGDRDAYDFTASLSVPQSASGIAVVGESRGVFGEVEEGETRYVYPVLYVAGGFPLGAYSLTLELEYYDAPHRVVDREGHVDVVQVGVVVDAVRPTDLALDVDVENYNVRAGADNEIGVALTNTGEEPVYDVEATLTSTSPGVVVLRDASHRFDEVGVEDRVGFRPLLGVSRATSLGTYPITLTLEYKDSDGVDYREGVTLGIRVESIEPKERTTIVVQDFRVKPSVVHPGDELTVEMGLKNVGADAYHVQAQLAIEPQSPLAPLSPTLLFVGDLSPNQLAKATYDLQVGGDAKAQPYTLQLAVSYYDVDGNPNGTTETVSIDVNSVHRFQMVNVQPSTVTAWQGEYASIEADLLLVGTETARFVEVEVVTDLTFLATAESYEYVGTVDPDSPVPFSIGFQVDPNTDPGSHSLQVQVTYWDTYNREGSTQIELPVVVENPSGTEVAEKTGLTLWDFVKILLGIRP